MSDRNLRAAEAAEMLGVPTSTLKFWRTRKEGDPGEHGPRYGRLGRLVFYKESDCQAWLDERFEQAG